MEQIKLQQVKQIQEISISDDCYITHKLYTHKNKYDMIFSFYHTNNIPLIMSITKTKILLGTTITDNYKTLTFNATKVCKLQKNNNHSLSINLVCKLIHHLSIQLKYLIENYGKCFIGYSLTNVVVIDDHIFVYIPNNEDICDIVDDNIMITHPFNHDDFYQTPETVSLSSIPSYIHYKTNYYSLACLIIDLLKKESTIQLEKIEKIEQLEEFTLNTLNTLDTLLIKDSKLYYFLKRCLTKEAEKRSLLYI